MLLSRFFLITASGVVTPCRNYAICWPSSHTGIARIALLVAVLFTTFKGLTSKVKGDCGEATRLINKRGRPLLWIYVNVTISVKAISLARPICCRAKSKPTMLANWKSTKNKPIIVVDGSGMQCRESANALTKPALKRCFVLKEGVAGWSGENLPLVRGK